MTDRFFTGASAAYNQTLDPLGSIDANSAGIVGTLVSQMASGGAYWGRSTSQVPFYVVTSAITLKTVTITNPSTHADLAARFGLGVPIPGSAIPSTDADHTLVIWNSQTKEWWELYNAVKNPDGSWTCDNGGYKHDTSNASEPGWFRHVVSSVDGSLLEDSYWGCSASRLALSGHLMIGTDLPIITAGHAPTHALCMAVKDVRPSFWSHGPAQACDAGASDHGTYSIPEGAIFDFDPNTDPTSLGLSADLVFLARTMQKFGLIVCDRTLSGISIRCENPGAYELAHGGTSPYTGILTSGNLASSVLWNYVRLRPLSLTSTPDTTTYTE